MTHPQPIRIAMWSGPRNISTAMMRSWENRRDTQVIDEPFYACYLQRSQSPHPGFETIMASQSSDYAEVARALSQGACSSTIQYQKHMTHHVFEDTVLDWVVGLKHCFLIRAPERVVVSYTKARGVCAVEDVGILQQMQLFERIAEVCGYVPPVVDSDDILRSPDTMLPKICSQLGIPFDEAMLSWPAGKRDSDGVWAPYWYHAVEQSTGFADPPSRVVTLSDDQKRVVDEVNPAYQRLYQQRIT